MKKILIKQMLSNNSQLAWACRRGMLELDLILRCYLTEAYPLLKEADKVRFILLLDCNDMQLFAWLIRDEEPQPQANAHTVIIKKIRDHVRCRISS